MSTATIPFAHIKGEPLNEAQQDYLNGFFAGLSARALK